MVSTVTIFLQGAVFVVIGWVGGNALVQAPPAADETQVVRAGFKPAPPVPGQVPPLPPRLPDGIPAFPGAWGGGMFTTGGRGGRVIEVTTLSDGGPGSLRAALQEQGPRIVVFRVAGILRLTSDIDIENPDITSAGQSAPGDGVCLAGNSLNINTRNVILRHLRVRRGRPEGGQGSDNIGGNPQAQVIVDHCSTSWGMDENLSLYRYMKPLPGGGAVKLPVENLTIQWCISSEALNATTFPCQGRPRAA